MRTPPDQPGQKHLEVSAQPSRRSSSPIPELLARPERSEHVKPKTGTEWCEAPHFQFVISGHVHVQMSDGAELDVGPGEVNVLPPGHDAWVIGDEPAVAADWGGAHVWGRAKE